MIKLIRQLKSYSSMLQIVRDGGIRTTSLWLSETYMNDVYVPSMHCGNSLDELFEMLNQEVNPGLDALHP